MEDVDIIFAGGGTAACVAAGRLAKANPDLKILLIEGGRNNFQDPTVVNPAVYLSHLAPDSKTALVCMDSAVLWLLLEFILLLRVILPTREGIAGLKLPSEMCSGRQRD